MTSLELRVLGFVGLFLSFVVALAVVATAVVLVALVRRIRAMRVRHPVPAPEAECPGLKEAA